MSQAVSHKGYQITQWPQHHPDIYYLNVDETPVAAATIASGAWRILLYGSDGPTLGAAVDGQEEAVAWLRAIGLLSTVEPVVVA